MAKTVYIDPSGNGWESMRTDFSNVESDIIKAHILFRKYDVVENRLDYYIAGYPYCVLRNPEGESVIVENHYLLTTFEIKFFMKEEVLLVRRIKEKGKEKWTFRFIINNLYKSFIDKKENEVMYAIDRAHQMEAMDMNSDIYFDVSGDDLSLRDDMW